MTIEITNLIVGNVNLGYDKKWRFSLVARDKALSRNEILVWLHISYGGLMEPKHISQKLRIPLHVAEQALTALKEKGILRDGRVL